jgi:hypothetical protein
MLSFFRKKSKIDPAEANIGNILLRMGFLSKEQLIKAIERKLSADRDQLLGEILIAQNAITRSQLDLALEMQVKIVGTVSYASSIKSNLARSIASAEDHSDVVKLREMAERITKKGE